MKSIYFLDKFKSFKLVDLLIKYIDFVRIIKPSKVVFLLSLCLSIFYCLNLDYVWMDEITVSGVFISLFFIFCFSIYSYFAELNVSIKLVEKKLFIRRSTLLNGLRDSSIILLIFIITYFSNLLFLEIFAFIVYFYNIGCIYKTCNHSDLAYKDLFFTLCLTSLKFLLIVVFVIISNTSNALLVSTVLCASPIYIAIFFNFKLKMLRMLYRASFLILLFFLSSVIFPYFFIACFSLMWIAKFYYFFKNNTQYPSFFNDYDKSN